MDSKHRIYILLAYGIVCGMFYLTLINWDSKDEDLMIENKSVWMDSLDFLDADNFIMTGSSSNTLQLGSDNILNNIHDIDSQYVTTTFHDYTVVVYEGKVVDNGVIHHANCKCKTKK